MPPEFIFSLGVNFQLRTRLFTYPVLDFPEIELEV